MKMDIKSYLEQFGDDVCVDLVGPFARTSEPFHDPVIFVDGGTRLRRAGEGIAIGDGDSWSGDLDIRLDQQKDYSDLAFALSSLPRNTRLIHLSGFLGGRRDHELINLGEVYGFLQSRGHPTTARFDAEIIGYSPGAWEFDHDGVFSIASFEETHVSINGDCSYPLIEPTRVTPMSSLCLSNEAKGTILITCTESVFVFLGDHPS